MQNSLKSITLSLENYLAMFLRRWNQYTNYQPSVMGARESLSLFPSLLLYVDRFRSESLEHQPRDKST